ncbi:DUF1501 domain-containing protein [Parvularcula mediterranea]|nr:DUF1501 domain-containing protein [Parvularcula mediterranea]
MLNRRRFLSGTAAASVALLPGAAVARAETDRRLVFIIQRGAQDGLHALPPYAERSYYDGRPKIGVPPPGTEGGALKLDGLFGLHPSLTGLHRLYEEGELVVAPAVATRYRSRSHFDGQNLLENGSGEPFGASSGFLNRALASLGSAGDRTAVNVGLAAPLMLQGPAKTRTFAPSETAPLSSDFVSRLQTAYSGDPVLAEAFESAIQDSRMVSLDPQEARSINRGRNMAHTAHIIGTLLRSKEGPRVAVLESNGWDTHDGINFRSRKLFSDLDSSILALKKALGPSWKKTVVVTISEFGRTARENGSKGTDHGTGGTSFLAGGAVRGGRIIGDWPGTRDSDLLRNRDLYPANPTEGLLKGLLHDHLGVTEAALESRVFPGSRSLQPVQGLLRS